MRVRVLLFASYAEALGTGQIDLDLPAGATAGSCLAEVRRRAGEGVPAGALVAVDQRYARPEQALAEGDEVAIIPPVAGG